MSRIRTVHPVDFDGSAIFRRMVDSAFDFLSQARGEIEAKPKYAVIHFATAIELILKARLLQEHWALVVAQSGDADRQAFRSGAAKTVTVDQAVRRLEAIAGVQLPPGAADAFRAISVHRNRMIHFFHEATSAEAEAEVRTKVTTELLAGWYHLVRVLRDWQDHFSEFDVQIARAERSMNGVRAYLSVVFEAARPRIDELAASGVGTVACPSCRYQAAAIEPVRGAVWDIGCLVCGLVDVMVAMPCPHDACGGTLHLTGYHMAKDACDRCALTIERELLVAFLGTGEAEYPEVTVRNCGLCTTPGAVVEHHGLFVCSGCLAHREDMQMCGWCGEAQLGYDLRESYYSGCEFCEGKGGWDAD